MEAFSDDDLETIKPATKKPSKSSATTKKKPSNLPATTVRVDPGFAMLGERE